MTVHTAEDGTQNVDEKIGHARLLYLVSPSDREIHLYSLRVPLKHRQGGEAHRAMQHLTENADRLRYGIVLLASPLDARTNLSKLVAFYERHGFVRTGRRGNFLGHPEMFRTPRSTARDRARRQPRTQRP